MSIALGTQMGKNAEAYVDDIVVKTREKDTLIQDLEETFANLRKVNIKLNPEIGQARPSAEIPRPAPS